MTVITVARVFVLSRRIEAQLRFTNLRRDQGQGVMFRKELKHDPHFLRVNDIHF